MTAEVSRPITVLLHRAAQGDQRAEEELLQALYRELHLIARRHMRGERDGHTLQPTALLNEAYVRLLRGGEVDWRDRTHFLATASTVMRRVLVDHARRRAAGKRGNGSAAVELHEGDGAGQSHSPDTLLVVDQALTQLEAVNSRQARIVELRFFAGLSEEEVAQLLQLSSRTVKREWVLAKAWLYEWLER